MTTDPLPPIDAVFETTVRVRYEETDRMGIVYHGKYFEYFEIGRTEWLRTRGLAYRDLETRGLGLVVTEANARYLAPARYDDVVTIRTWLTELGRASMEFRYELARDVERLAEGSTKLACVGANGRPRRLPEEIVALTRPGTTSSGSA